MESPLSCAGCPETALFQCSCEAHQYCSKACQEAEWEAHRVTHRAHLLRGCPRGRVLAGHEGSVSGICSLKKGLFASGSDDKTIRIWRKETGECLKVLEGHTSCVFDLCSLGNDLIASAASDETVRVWNVDSGDCKVLLGHTDWVLSVCPLLPVGCGLLASASNDRTARIWNVDSGECLKKLVHEDWVVQVCAIGENRIACASGNAVYLWNTENGECIGALEGHEDLVDGICVFGEGRLASGSRDKTIRIWDVGTGECLRTMHGHTLPIRTLRVSGDFLASASTAEIRIWQTDSSECVITLVPKRVDAICWLGPYRLAAGVEKDIKLLEFL
jgi:WD40 repeat protein